MKTALVAGSTGLVGGELIEQLLKSDRYGIVKAITRRALGRSDPKLKPLSINFRDLEKYQDELRADDIYCCLGTTMAKAGTKEKFREVDFEFPVALARSCHTAGAKQFLLVSALGANKGSSLFYNRVKGDAEEAILNIDYECVHVFRPSLLLGSRKEHRAAEDAAKFFYRIFGFLMPDKYKAIEARKVAWAMQHFASLDKKGRFVHESKDILNL